MQMFLTLRLKLNLLSEILGRIKKLLKRKKIMEHYQTIDRPHDGTPTEVGGKLFGVDEQKDS